MTAPLTVDGISIAHQMQAMVAAGPGSPLALSTVAVPQPGPGEVLIRVIACGVCHSDIHAIDGDWSPPPIYPVIPGHEITGRVVAVGAAPSPTGSPVAALGVGVGDLVGVAWLWSTCGSCEWCTSGRESICPAAEATGYTVAGGYAGYVVAKADHVVSLPDGADPYVIAPVLCAGVTTYRGLKRSGAIPGQWVAIVGVGGLGHLAVQFAVAMGLRVIAIDVDATKLSLAQSHGAELTLDARSGNAEVAADIVRTCGGAHGVLVTATSSAAFEGAVALARPGGTVVFVGLPGHAADRFPMSVASLVNTEISVRGSAIGTRADLAEALSFAARGLVRPTIELVDFADAPQAIAALRQGTVTGRLVLRVS